MPNLSQMVNQLKTQREQLKREAARLDAAISALRGLNASNGAGARRQVRGPLSAAARKKIAAAQRARWAAWKAKQKKAA